VCEIFRCDGSTNEMNPGKDGAVELIPSGTSSEDIGELKDIFQKFLVDQKERKCTTRKKMEVHATSVSITANPPPGES